MTTRVDRRRLSEVLWSALGAGAFFGSAMQVFDVLLFDETWSWWEVLARSAFFTIVMALGLAVSPRFSAVARERATVDRAVSTGVLPPEAYGEWLGRLTAERHRLRYSRTAGPGLTALVAVLVAVAALQPEGPGGWGWLYAVGVAAVGGVEAAREHRRLQTADRLVAQLEERLAHA